MISGRDSKFNASGTSAGDSDSAMSRISADSVISGNVSTSFADSSDSFTGASGAKDSTFAKSSFTAEIVIPSSNGMSSNSALLCTTGTNTATTFENFPFPAASVIARITSSYSLECLPSLFLIISTASATGSGFVAFSLTGARVITPSAGRSSNSPPS